LLANISTDAFIGIERCDLEMQNAASSVSSDKSEFSIARKSQDQLYFEIVKAVVSVEFRL
jgi:hypothetical protein